MRSGRSASWRFETALLAVCLPLLVGCGQKSVLPWGLANISGHMPALQFDLTDDTGKTVTGEDYLGKITLLYFGYTRCPDVCPTTLATLAKALRRLGPQANQVRVLFVSVDPKRDTRAVLRLYLSAFGPEFVGLSGTHAELDAITKRYRVAYRLGKHDRKGNYTVYHSSAIFIFDKRGQVRLLANYTDSPTTIATDLKRLLRA